MAAEVQSRSSKWRLIYNPEGDAADITAYAAGVAEGRIAGKYQLSNIEVLDTLIVQRAKRPGIVVGADIDLDREAAKTHGLQVAKAPRMGRNSARAVGTVQLADLMANASRNFKAAESVPEDVAVLIYTSGTTSYPKGAMITQGNLDFQCNTVMKSFIPAGSDERFIWITPLFHVFALCNVMLYTLVSGNCGVLVSHYNPNTLLRIIDENQATILPAWPTIYSQLLDMAAKGTASIPKSLRFCVSGGSPLALTLIRRFAEVFDTKIIEGYGLTESTGAVTSGNGNQGVYKEGSIGPAAHGVEMKVVDDAGSALPDGEEGELVVKSHSLFAGYWQDPESTAAAIVDGWLHTGDLGRRDEDGFFFITDRKRDIIITRGGKISPREVEEVLMQHAGVGEAALVALEGEGGGETVTAFIEPAAGAPAPTPEELREHAERSLDEYKRPAEYRITATLPKSAAGKLLRTELRGETEDRRLIYKER